MKDMRLIDLDKKMKISELLFEVDDLLVQKFFDPDSDKILDKKIEVLTELLKGVPPSEIPEYYNILELYPDDDRLWD